MPKKKIDVLIPHGYKPPKKDVEVAWILARRYRKIVQILRPSGKYKEKTPDFSIDGELFELKTLRSGQVRQLTTLLFKAKEQADNIVIDIRKTKITLPRAREICKTFLAKHKKYKVFLVVSASEIREVT